MRMRRCCKFPLEAMRYLVSLRRLHTQWKAFRTSLCSTSVLTDTDVVVDRASTEPTLQGEPLAEDQRVLRAAILGVPNAGKTTLVNQLLGQKLFAVSPKKHTTTRSIAGVFTQGTRQIILMDTPGVIPYQVGRKWRASKSFLTGPQRSLLESHLALVVVDASDKKMRHELDKELMQALTRYSHIPAILILNKVDIVRHKHTLLHITENLTGAAEKWMREDMQKRAERKKTTLEKPPHMSDESVENRKPDPDFLSTADPSASPGGGVGDLSTQEEESHAAPVVETFSKVFMVSALTGDGVPDLREYLLTCTRPGLWEYSVAVQSDQSELALVEDIVREKLLQHLHREIPYVITQTNLIWEREGDTLMIYQNLTCRSKNQASIVIGPAGSTIQTITAEAKDDVEALLGCPVDLTLNVKTHK